MKCKYRYCQKDINYGRPDRKFCNKNCKSRENKLEKEIKSLDRMSVKTKDFIEKANKIHESKYSYDLVVFKNVRTKVQIICPEHGIFDQTPSGHIYSKQGCEKCSRESHKLTSLTKDRLENLKKVHNNKYLYEDSSVVKGFINITCENHGVFSQYLYFHEYGHGCYKCEKDSRIKAKKKVCICCGAEKLKSEYIPKYRRCKECVENKIVPEFKFCNKCGVKSPIENFQLRKGSTDDHRNECKSCMSVYKVDINRIYKKKNRKIIQEKDMIYRKNRMVTDPFYKSKVDARNLVRKSLKEKGYSKKSKTEEILGCSFIEFKGHLESLFAPGMSWDNRIDWHIDHIVPLDFAISENEVLKLNHFKNLRPLWVDDNQKKSNTITEKTDIYYDILNRRIV